MPDPGLLMRLAGAITDGTNPDWMTAASTAAGGGHRQLVEELRVIAELAAVHRGAAPDPSREAESAPIRSRWGPLEIRERLGEGRFGTVYLAWDPELERQVALKLLRDTPGAPEIVREGRLLARLRHPNVVTVYRVDHYDGAVGLWMEYVEGLTLSGVLAASGALGPRETTLIGVDLCGAVEAVHRAGLLHRDIKAQNVIREASGRIVLMDFGGGEIRTDRTPPGSIIGTPLYLAPEIFEGAPATIASDIYSIGVLLFHLLTRDYPVAGQTMAQIEAAHARGARRRLADVRPDVPAGLSQIVERALERDPGRRYRNSASMQQDLIAVLQQRDHTSEEIARIADQPGRTTAVAVLPFVEEGSNDLEYFCNGLADELLTALAKVPGLRVASRTSAFRLAQTEKDIRVICRQLGVDAVLEGTVRTAGESVRITAQLVSGSDGCHLWSEAYDRSLSDIFAVQEDIARQVVERLQVSLARVPRSPLIGRHTQNARAYHLYLKGRFYWTRRYHGGLISALEHFKKAIEEDAGYALAYAGLADAYSFMGIYAVQRPRGAFAQAAAAVERALTLDPHLPEAHTSLAFIRLANDWDLPAAAREFARALQLDPRQAVTRIYYSWLLVLQKDIPGAMAQVRTAEETEPLSPLVTAGAGHTLYLARRYDEAVLECEKALEIDPSFILAIHVTGMCRALQGRLEEAIELAEKAAAMAGRAPFYLGVLGHYYARRGALDRVAAVLAELEEIARRRYVPPHCMTYIYAGYGELDRAFEWQAKAEEDGASPFYYLSPLIDNLHDDPRHIDQMRRMGWPATRP